MALQVVPEGLASTSAAVDGATAQLAVAHTALAPAVAATVSPGVASVSLLTAGGLGTSDIEHPCAGGEGIGNPARAGIAVGECDISYSVGDRTAASYSIVAMR
ncbi:hypothetical protein B8W66_03995 [Mycobacterium decipiens]|uniref:PE domain-containing protein n=1 Tax=Mycobacterium decipiens TaxID=1430326 RepID=A0A1X2LZN1_9MYCO|nr:hypothetical protein B8W66_03995 [Mycobacterium decipiens]